MKTKVEIQHFHGCPNSPILIDRVKEAIKDFDEVYYTEAIIDTNERAEEVKFRGSPTLLINGVDFENLLEPVNSNLACRFYPNGLPTVEAIRKRLTDNQFFK